MALMALIAHPRDENMGSYLDIAKQALELLAVTVPVTTGCNPDAAVSCPDDGGRRFADWVRRPGCHGRMGWEAPGIPESDRWWARCDFDDLPEVPEGFRLGELPKLVHHDYAPCVSGATADTLDLDSKRPVQSQLRAFGGV